MGIRNWLKAVGLAGTEPSAQKKKKHRTGGLERTADSETVRIPIAEIEEAASATTVRVPSQKTPEETVVVSTAGETADTLRVPTLQRSTSKASLAPATDDAAQGTDDTRADEPSAPPDPQADAAATQYFSVESKPAPDLVGVLVATEGPLRGEIYRVEDGENQIGRENANIRLRSSRVSRFHARIHHADGCFTLEANSEIRENNPTYLNGQPIVESSLEDGDEVLVGDCSLKFRTL